MIPESFFYVVCFDRIASVPKLRPSTLNCFTAISNWVANRASSCAAACVSVAPLAVFWAACATPNVLYDLMTALGGLPHIYANFTSVTLRRLSALLFDCHFHVFYVNHGVLQSLESIGCG